ncbi:iron-sulfur cluster assembly accessory protein [bacterium]|nr:iron-sulfur cluster assembly accessory protein [bacterium]
MLYLTSNAEKRITKWLGSNPQASIKIAMRTAGCTGLMYEVKLTDEFDPQKDFAVKYNDFNILIEHKYLPALSGATLDYITEGLNSQFKIIENPNEKAACGCGESFSV